MAHVVALYRHPIKGFSPESVDTLTVQADGRVAGDRVLAFRFADAVTPETHDGLDYWPKAKGLALQDFPALAALRTSYDDTSRRMRIEHEGELLAEAGLDDDGRAELVAAVTDFVLSTREGRRLQRPGRLPLVLVGDGATSRFQDRARGYVSLHSQEAGKTISPDNHDRIHGASVALGYDTRDLYRNPRCGHQHLAAIGWFGQVLGGTVDYTQLMVDVRRFQPLPWGRTLAVGARWIRQTGTVPEYRQVRLGGSSTIRGYADGAVEGDHGAFGSIEWRFDLAPPVSRGLWLIENVDVGVSGALFADAGATWGRAEDGGAADPLTWSDVATSFGAGLRLLVPWVEVVRADLAITESGRIAVVLGEGMKF